MKKKTIKATLTLKKVSVSNFDIRGGRRLGTHYDFCDPDYTKNLDCVLETAEK